MNSGNNKKNYFPNNPNYQISGQVPNYTQNLPYDYSSISQTGPHFKQSVDEYTQFTRNNNKFKPYSSFSPPDGFTSKASFMNGTNDYSQYKIKEAFKENNIIMRMPDNVYQDNTLYNNMNKDLLKEELIDINISIDSKDRDIKLYPNPFAYTVKFGPVINSGNNFTSNGDLRKSFTQEIREQEILKKKNEIARRKQNQIPIYQRQLTEQVESIIPPNSHILTNPDLIKQYVIDIEKASSPYINTNFRNIKFLRVDYSIVPRFNSVMINNEWDYKRMSKKEFIKDDYEKKRNMILKSRYIPDDISTDDPIGDRYIQIYIKEIDNIDNFGTNEITDKSFILILDKVLGITYFKCINSDSSMKTYRTSALGNINNLSFEFYDSWGKPLTLNQTQINYEKKQLLNTKLYDPYKCGKDVITNTLKTDKRSYFEMQNEIIKCFVIINYDIKYKIPYYNIKNNCNCNINEDETIQLILNKSDYKFKCLQAALNSFVDPINGFNQQCFLDKNDKPIKINIDQFIDSVIWFNRDFSKYKKEILHNINALDTNYRNFGFTVLDILKGELVNLPINKLYQNTISLTLSAYKNDLNTKIDYYK